MSRPIDPQFIDRFQDAFREGNDGAAGKAKEAENVRVVEEVSAPSPAETSTPWATSWPKT